ncbi:MAG: hypothetical protein RJA26_1175, partial [Actinomycetota bacterium]
MQGLFSAPEDHAVVFGGALSLGKAHDSLVTCGKDAGSRAVHEFGSEGRLEVSDTLPKFGVFVFQFKDSLDPG